MFLSMQGPLCVERPHVVCGGSGSIVVHTETALSFIQILSYEVNFIQIKVNIS